MARASCFPPANPGRPTNLKSESWTLRPGKFRKSPVLTVSLAPRWSPDGRYLAALDFQQLSKTLRIFDFQTGSWSDWATDPVFVGYPAWTSDSRYVEYSTDTQVRRIKVGDAHPETLFNFKDLRQFDTREFGAWTDNAADNSRMFLRDGSTENLHTLDVEFP